MVPYRENGCCIRGQDMYWDWLYCILRSNTRYTAYMYVLIYGTLCPLKKGGTGM